MGSLLEARRIYVASSWRNDVQPFVVESLRVCGHEVYDFRNPRPGDDGFRWSEIDPHWLAWKPAPAHLEAGWACGAGKPTAILLHEDKFEPELMYLCADFIAVDLSEITDWCDGLRRNGNASEAERAA